MDDSRGASAILGAVRAARTFNFMTKSEATQLGISEDDRRLHVRVESSEKALFVNVLAFDPDALTNSIVDKFVTGARIYVDGKLDLNECTAEDGVVRRGLSCLSFHTRLSQIGRNKPVKTKQDLPSSTPAPSSCGRTADMNDDIPF